MIKYLLGFIVLSAFTLNAHAQTSFSGIDYIDINNIKASALSTGGIWSAQNESGDYCQFPNGSGMNVMGLGGLWMSGYDASNNLHASATLYHYNNQPDNDYYPGPLNTNDTSDNAIYQKWDKVWKINYSDIENFLSQSNHTIANTPISILQWPGAGNVYTAGSNGDSLYSSMIPGRQYAPFVDVNNDGIYEPLLGDYPDIKGDQMLWWIYNDNGGPHTATFGLGFGVEIHASAYAYHRGTLIDNVVYYQYDIINESSNTYDSFRIAQFADEDLGYMLDDRIGYDTTHRMGFAYNGRSFDSVYGTQIPIAGVTLINMPEENGVPTDVKSFVIYNNDFSIVGNPINGAECNFYMHGKETTGVPFNDSLSTIDPFVICDSNLVLGDRRFVIATGDMHFLPGETKSMTMALVVANTDTNHACPNVNLPDIITVADTAWAIYMNPLPQSVQYINNIQAEIKVYPNPTTDKINITTQASGISYKLMSITGATLQTGILQSGDNSLSLNNVAPGIYLLQLRDNKGGVKMAKIIKD